MVQGIDPASAVDRLKRFKEEYRIRERKNNLYQVTFSRYMHARHPLRLPLCSSPVLWSTQVGEEIFSLPVTEYPDLRATERELKLLDQLYGLYTEVLDIIRVRQTAVWFGD